jgi:hypothetical protein
MAAAWKHSCQACAIRISALWGHQAAHMMLTLLSRVRIELVLTQSDSRLASALRPQARYEAEGID